MLITIPGECSWSYLYYEDLISNKQAFFATKNLNILTENNLKRMETKLFMETLLLIYYNHILESNTLTNLKVLLVLSLHCVKSVHIRSYCGPQFPAFGLNTERYSLSLRIQSKYGKMRTRITPNTGTFHAVLVTSKFWTKSTKYTKWKCWKCWNLLITCLNLWNFRNFKTKVSSKILKLGDYI